MSLKAKQAVIEDSPSRGNNRLVLMAIADCANEMGTDAFPSQEYIAQWANCSVRTVQRAVQELVEDGELRVERETTRQTNYYTVVCAWNRAMGLSAPRPVSEEDTRQVDVCHENEGQEPSNPAAKDTFSCGDKDTPDKLTGVTRHSTPANVGGSDTTLLASQIRPLTDLSPTRARPDNLTGVAVPPRQGSIIPRGGAVKWSQQMEKQHASCHPEVCSWRDDTVRQCMPLGLVDAYARKLTSLKLDDAIADVIAWARADAPPADYVAPGDIFAHWRLRWDLTRASASSARGGANAEVLRVPGAAATDVLLDELTSGRFRS